MNTACCVHCAEAVAGRRCAYSGLCEKMLLKLVEGKGSQDGFTHFFCNSNGMSCADLKESPVGGRPLAAAADDRDVKREYAEGAARIIWRERLARSLYCGYCDRCSDDVLARFVYEPNENLFGWNRLRLQKPLPDDL